VHETLLKHLTSTKKTFNKMEKQTAVSWLIDQLEKYELYSKISFQCLKEIEQAKEMHKQETIDTWEDGHDSFSTRNAEQYYKETFGKL
jgi:hypothetical protein